MKMYVWPNREYSASPAPEKDIKWLFTPKDDITAGEIAEILTRTHPLNKPVSGPPDLDPILGNQKRHFTVVE